MGSVGNVYWVLQILRQGQWYDTPINNKDKSIVARETLGLKEGSYRLIERFLNEDILLGKRVVKKCC